MTESQAEEDDIRAGEMARDALRRLLGEFPVEFSKPPHAEPERGRQEFRVIKRRNVRAVHAAVWDLQVALGVNYPPERRPCAACGDTGLTPTTAPLSLPTRRGCYGRSARDDGGPGMTIWRDVDSERRNYGITLWLTGGEVRLGRRLYRWRYLR